jgi:hypothetical protein
MVKGEVLYDSRKTLEPLAKKVVETLTLPPFKAIHYIRGVTWYDLVGWRGRVEMDGGLLKQRLLSSLIRNDISVGQERDVNEDKGKKATKTASPTASS